MQGKASILELEFPCKYITQGNFSATLCIGSKKLHSNVNPRLFFNYRSVLFTFLPDIFKVFGPC